MPSVIFCGTPAFAVPSLHALAEDAAFDVRLVITREDKPVGRTKTPSAPPVKQAAEKLGIEVFQPMDINAALPGLLRERPDLTPDFLIVVAYGMILSEETLALPKIAPVNLHGSLLPRWRGASPVEHAIISNDSETGVTLQIMSPELDAGPILATAAIALDPADTAPLIREQLAAMGASLLRTTLKEALQPIKQPAEGITYCRKLSRQDGIVDPASFTAEEIDRRVRAFQPWPGVACTLDGHALKLIETSLSPVDNAIPLSCKANSTLYLVTVQEAGKKAMSGADWSRGRHTTR